MKVDRSMGPGVPCYLEGRRAGGAGIDLPGFQVSKAGKLGRREGGDAEHRSYGGAGGTQPAVVRGKLMWNKLTDSAQQSTNNVGGREGK